MYSKKQYEKDVAQRELMGNKVANAMPFVALAIALLIWLTR